MIHTKFKALSERSFKCWSSSDDLAILDEEKAEVFNNFYAWVLKGKFSRHTAQDEKGRWRDWENEDPKPTVGKGHVHDHLRNPNVQKSVGPGEIYSRVLRELADDVVRVKFVMTSKRER